MVNKKLFVITLILTILVFIAGVSVGLGLDYFRIKDVSNSFEKDRLDIESFIVEQQLLSSLEDKGCSVLKDRVSELSKSTYETGSTLEKYESVGYSNREYNLLKRENIILKVRLIQALDYLKNNCGENEHIILFFYERNNNDCVKQGYVLDELNKEENYKYNIFAFDSKFKEEPLISMLNKEYDIKEVPTLIVDGFKKEGYTSTGELKAILK